MEYNYVNYANVSARFDGERREFEITHDIYGRIVSGMTFSVRTMDLNEVEKDFGPSDFGKVFCTTEKHMRTRGLTVSFSEGPEELGALTVCAETDGRGMAISIRGNQDEEYVYSLCGALAWGEDPENKTFSMSSKKNADWLRAACGPASSPFDDLLFDRENDRCLVFTETKRPGLFFDYETGSWRFDMHFHGNCPARFRIETEDGFYERAYSINYAPAKKRAGYKRPPVGWMTWYAVKFGACEEAVLENARIQEKELKAFGADTIWVDWEWYHGDFFRTETGCDTTHPDKGKYPNGMKYLADKIREMGFVPAIWIGALHEVRESDFIRENPDTVLVHRESWCGPYWFDPTHPKYLTGFVPEVFRMLTEKWGYRVVKWDALPRALDYFDIYHDRFSDKSKSSTQAMRAVVQKARDIVGEDVYMMSCHGEAWHDITMYSDIFDAARVGGDIFGWDDFIKRGISRMYEFYRFHNILQLLDLDNVVLRGEFNDMNQARSRASLVSLTGVRFTIGDDLRELDPERLEIIKRAIPVPDVHTMNAGETEFRGDFARIELFLKTPFEEYLVVDIMNLKGYAVQSELCLEELEADGGAYLAFDFWNRNFLGRSEGVAELEFEPFESKVIALRKCTGTPQIVSTSRHVTQGACEIKALGWDAQKLILSGVSQTVAGDEYRIYVYVPEKFEVLDDALKRKDKNLYIFTAMPGESGELAWSFRFGARQ